MGKSLSEFRRISSDPYSAVRERKEKTGKRVVACFPMHLPEEIIHAAGMLPVVFWGSDEPITVGHSHLPPYNCGLSRSVVDDAIKGKLSFIDGMVFYDTCLQARALPFIIGRNARPGYMETVYLPPTLTNPVTRSYLVENLLKLKASLEEFGGKRISSEDLRQSILLYNQHRKLMERLYSLRRKSPGLLTAGDMVSIVQASLLVPKEEHNELLAGLLRDLESSVPSVDGRHRVFLSGNMCQAPPVDLLASIERAGLVVVDDDLYVGSRYFANPVSATGDSIEALADRFMKRSPPCPTKSDWETDWTDYIAERAKRSKAKGVIVLLVKYCPPHLVYYPDVKRGLADRGIPEIMLETEHEVVSREQARTRLEAFVETLEGC